MDGLANDVVDTAELEARTLLRAVLERPRFGGKLMNIGTIAS